MNNLEMYKRLSNEDKANLIIYCIYDSIYDVVKNEDIEISDKLAVCIQELVYNIYIEDNDRKLSASEIAHFITENFVKDNRFMDMIKDIEYDDILTAVEDNDYDFYKDDEMER